MQVINHIPPNVTLHLFCCVIDNFGDVGVCWRLARQLVHEYGVAVTLIIDDLHSFQKICPEIDVQAAAQQTQGVLIHDWNAAPPRVADVVIEAFGCELPAHYLASMVTVAADDAQPIWINLEYLSAEDWVEGCHGLISPQSASSLVKYFFFPGFSNQTGGLLLERDLIRQRDAFQQDAAAMADFFARLNVPMVAMAPDACKISLFCYPHAPCASLLRALQNDTHASPVICFVPEGVAVEAVSAFLGQPAIAGARATQGNLTLQVLPFLPQADYDKLLWACDMNFVRGEDSFVRAQWAGRPFVWHIYPQDEAAHLVKLEAFLQRYTANMSPDVARSVADWWHVWNAENAEQTLSTQWQTFHAAMPQLQEYGSTWSQQLIANGDLAANLMMFIKNRLK